MTDRGLSADNASTHFLRLLLRLYSKGSFVTLIRLERLGVGFRRFGALSRRLCYVRHALERGEASDAKLLPYIDDPFIVEVMGEEISLLEPECLVMLLDALRGIGCLHSRSLAEMREKLLYIGPHTRRVEPYVVTAQQYA